MVICEERSPLNSNPDVVFVPPDETLYYPNVDSCLAITYVLDNNALVGGHAGYGERMNPQDNAIRVNNEMPGKLQGHQVSVVVFAGDFQDYKVDGLTLPPKLNRDQHVRKIQLNRGQLHIYINPSNQGRRIRIDLRGSPVFERNIADLRPLETVG